ncbi:MAG: Uma2 family endonuclease [Cyanobacteria bacterium P01_D01_bin.44]
MTSMLLNDVTAALNLDSDESEEQYLISGVSWQQYEILLNRLGDSPWYRVAYLEGVLEIMAPSRRRESKKDNIGRLLSSYFEEARIRFYGLGSTTFRRKLKERGAEPDVSYCIGTEKEFPDLAIEVIETSGGVDKLSIYKGLGVSEVWFWQQSRFEIHRLRGDEYEQIVASELLPNLDLTLLATYIEHPEPLAAILEFRAKIRAQMGKSLS